MKLLLYCTKAKPYLTRNDFPNEKGEFQRHYQTLSEKGVYHLVADREKEIFNGKIVAECDFEVEEIFCEKLSTGVGYDTCYYLENGDVFYMECCLTNYELENYLGCKAGGEAVGYAIHIKNLHIFDKPKELDGVYKIENVGDMLFTTPLTTAPQNMMRVSISHWGYATYEPNDIHILISIHPEWLCKILNGEKTIEVRKKVLKEMLK